MPLEKLEFCQSFTLEHQIHSSQIFLLVHMQFQLDSQGRLDTLGTILKRKQFSPKGNLIWLWVHKKCSGLSTWQSTQITDVQGTACPLDGRPHREVQVRPDKLEVVPSFCYLGDLLSTAVAVNFQPQHVWKPTGRSSRSCYQFSLPATSLSRIWLLYNTCVWSRRLHASKTWALTKPNLQHLQRYVLFVHHSLLAMTNPNQLCDVLLFVCSKMADETTLSSKLPVADRTREI